MSTPPSQRRQHHRVHTRRSAVGAFLLGRTLGKGAFSVVRSARHKDTGTKHAVKIIKKKLNSKQMEKLKREVALMRLTKHPRVVRLDDVLETNHHLYIVQERMQGGELFDYIVASPKQRLTRDQTLRVASQCIEALEFFHEHHICHRDLKLENLLLDKNGNVKIADFGLANIMPSTSLLDTYCGSPHYAAPEVVSHTPYDGRFSDVWSLGVIVFACITGMLPFDEDNFSKLLKLIKSGTYTIPSHVDADIQDFIRSTMCVDPKRRLKTHQLRHHPVFKDATGATAYFPCPPIASPAKLHQRDHPLVTEADIDTGLVTDLVTLGSGSKQEVVAALLSGDENNTESLLYHLLAARDKRLKAQTLALPCSAVPADATPTHPLTPASPATPKKACASSRPAGSGDDTPVATATQAATPKTNDTRRHSCPVKLRSLSHDYCNSSNMSVVITCPSQRRATTRPVATRVLSGSKRDRKRQLFNLSIDTKLATCPVPALGLPLSARSPASSSPASSWMQRLLAKRGSTPRRPASTAGLLTAFSMPEIRARLLDVLAELGVNAQRSSDDEYSMECCVQGNLDSQHTLQLQPAADEEKTIVPEDHKSDLLASSPRPSKPATEPQNIVFTVQLAKSDVHQQLNAVHICHLAGNLQVYRSLYSTIADLVEL